MLSRIIRRFDRRTSCQQASKGISKKPRLFLNKCYTSFIFPDKSLNPCCFMIFWIFHFFSYPGFKSQGNNVLKEYLERCQEIKAFSGTIIKIFRMLQVLCSFNILSLILWLPKKETQLPASLFLHDLIEDIMLV